MNGELALTKLLSGTVIPMFSWLMILVMASSILLAQPVTIKEERFPATAVALKVAALPAFS